MSERTIHGRIRSIIEEFGNGEVLEEHISEYETEVVSSEGVCPWCLTDNVTTWYYGKEQLTLVLHCLECDSYFEHEPDPLEI